MEWGEFAAAVGPSGAVATLLTVLFLRAGDKVTRRLSASLERQSAALERVGELLAETSKQLEAHDERVDDQHREIREILRERKPSANGSATSGQ